MIRLGPGKMQIESLNVDVAEFDLDRTEVTTDEFALCVRSKGCTRSPGDASMIRGSNYGLSSCNLLRPNRERDPVNCVSFNDAARYCKWRQKRLPTEEEWIFAAGWPESEPVEVAEVPRAHPFLRGNYDTTPVGSYPLFDRTSAGILDMHASMAEWTSSPACSRFAERCLRMDRIVWRGRNLGSPHRLKGLVDAAGTMAADLGFRCAR